MRPQTIGAAGKLQDGWFAGGSAAAAHGDARAAARTACSSPPRRCKDFQLRPGDLLRLRLQDGRTKQFKTVPFHYVGVAKEFPTAPQDSFFVANAELRRQRDRQRRRRRLPRADRRHRARRGGRGASARGVGTSAQVTDIVDQRKVVGSNLTAVELSGLTRSSSASRSSSPSRPPGLALGLGFQERRRTFAIASALGAKRRQLGGFVWGESLFVTAGGLVLGAAAAVAISDMLVKVLTGVFDPPPDALAVPWAYLGGVVVLTVGAVGVAGRADAARAAPAGDRGAARPVNQLFVRPARVMGALIPVSSTHDTLHVRVGVILP